MRKVNDPQLKIRLPPDQKAWIDRQADRNRTSRNSEVVRAIRERMDRDGHPENERAPAVAPAEARN